MSFEIPFDCVLTPFSDFEWCCFLSAFKVSDKLNSSVNLFFSLFFFGNFILMTCQSVHLYKTSSDLFSFSFLFKHFLSPFLQLFNNISFDNHMRISWYPWLFMDYRYFIHSCIWHGFIMTRDSCWIDCIWCRMGNTIFLFIFSFLFNKLSSRWTRWLGNSFFYTLSSDRSLNIWVMKIIDPNSISFHGFFKIVS